MTIFCHCYSCWVSFIPRDVKSKCVLIKQSGKYSCVISGGCQPLPAEEMAWKGMSLMQSSNCFPCQYVCVIVFFKDYVIEGEIGKWLLNMEICILVLYAKILHSNVNFCLDITRLLSNLCTEFNKSSSQVIKRAKIISLLE